MVDAHDGGVPGAVGRRVDELPTPCLVVRLDAMDRNIGELARAVHARGVALRPHVKTHKTAEITERQFRAGARGITVAKVGEAEMLAPVVRAAGTDGSILVGHEVVTRDAAERLVALAGTVRVVTCVDSLHGARVLSGAALARGTTLEVLIDVDTGLGRTGVEPERAVEFGLAVARLPALRVAGIFSYAGYRQRVSDVQRRRAWARQEAQTAVAVSRELRDRGVGAVEVSVAGSSSACFAGEVAGVTEVRPGTYVFGDMNYARLGIHPIEQCALSVRSTVVSRPAPGRAVLDAGSKTLSADRASPDPDAGFGVIVGRPGCRLAQIWEEHTVVELSDADRDLGVGDVVQVVPNHVCPVVNLADHLYGVQDDVVVQVFPVVARGRVT